MGKHCQLQQGRTNRKCTGNFGHHIKQWRGDYRQRNAYLQTQFILQKISDTLEQNGFHLKDVSEPEST